MRDPLPWKQDLFLSYHYIPAFGSPTVRSLAYIVEDVMVWGRSVGVCLHDCNSTWLWHICWRIKANIFISDILIHYHTHYIILHITHDPLWGLVFMGFPLGIFVYIDRALPARMIGMDLAWYISDVNFVNKNTCVCTDLCGDRCDQVCLL